jgi:transposase
MNITKIFIFCIEKLKTKANLYTNVKVHVITEEYTSQKCLNCKKLTKTKDELFKCKVAILRSIGMY